MNWHQVEGNWKQFKGHARRKWGKLTDDDIEAIKGDRDILVGKLQERYGERREVIEERVDSWAHSLEDGN